MRTRTITFPDGTIAKSSELETADCPWAIAASAMTPDEIRTADEGRIDSARREVSALTAALAGMVVTFEVLDLPTEIEPRRILRASLEGSDVFVLTDADHGLVDVTTESITRGDVPFFVGLGLSHEEGLATAVAARIASLEESISQILLSLTGATSKPEARLSTRVLSWHRSEEAARKVASRIRASVTVLRADLDEVVPMLG